MDRRALSLPKLLLLAIHLGSTGRLSVAQSELNLDVDSVPVPLGCGAPPHVNNSQASTATALGIGTLNSTTGYTYFCSQGYRAEGTSAVSDVIECLENGTWSESSLRCMAVEDTTTSTSSSLPLIIVIAILAVLLVLALLGMFLYRSRWLMSTDSGQAVVNKEMERMVNKSRCQYGADDEADESASNARYLSFHGKTGEMQEQVADTLPRSSEQAVAKSLDGRHTTAVTSRQVSDTGYIQVVSQSNAAVDVSRQDVNPGDEFGDEEYVVMKTDSPRGSVSRTQAYEGPSAESGKSEPNQICRLSRTGSKTQVVGDTGASPSTTPRRHPSTGQAGEPLYRNVLSKAADKAANSDLYVNKATIDYEATYVKMTGRS